MTQQQWEWWLFFLLNTMPYSWNRTENQHNKVETLKDKKLNVTVLGEKISFEDCTFSMITGVYQKKVKLHFTSTTNLKIIIQTLANKIKWQQLFKKQVYITQQVSKVRTATEDEVHGQNLMFHRSWNQSHSVAGH